MEEVEDDDDDDDDEEESKIGHGVKEGKFVKETFKLSMILS